MIAYTEKAGGIISERYRKTKEVDGGIVVEIVDNENVESSKGGMTPTNVSEKQSQKSSSSGSKYSQKQADRPMTKIVNYKLLAKDQATGLNPGLTLGLGYHTSTTSIVGAGKKDLAKVSKDSSL
jgi:hypothetical protein